MQLFLLNQLTTRMMYDKMRLVKNATGAASVTDTSPSNPVTNVAAMAAATIGSTSTLTSTD
ncbi:MAG: hypothetical protein AAF597_08760, partial [Bacteroidota bacterium]